MNYFESQLEASIPLIDPSIFKGRSIYGEYEIGDKILYFFDLIDNGVLDLRTIVERDIETFLSEYTFVRDTQTDHLIIPVFFKNI